ncbi:unnamed protein product [Dovyalis caffra]|uniref:Uncharacterized protein n=1 Tax=Dovyalis caffra TaxID=77055 RepID=A0AAV1RFK7_9ROSI|nr:unnamed protein product [Dovyalis caffra]
MGDSIYDAISDYCVVLWKSTRFTPAASHVKGHPGFEAEWGAIGKGFTIRTRPTKKTLWSLISKLSLSEYV